MQLCEGVGLSKSLVLLTFDAKAVVNKDFVSDCEGTVVWNPASQDGEVGIWICWKQSIPRFHPSVRAVKYTLPKRDKSPSEIEFQSQRNLVAKETHTHTQT